MGKSAESGMRTAVSGMRVGRAIDDYGHEVQAEARVEETQEQGRLACRVGLAPQERRACLITDARLRRPVRAAMAKGQVAVPIWFGFRGESMDTDGKYHG
jgi:hypothetical protein